MNKTKYIFKRVRGIAGIVGIFAVIILGLAGLSYGFSWLWNQFSFGVSGLGLGLLIAGGTYYAKFINSNSSEYMASLEKDLGFNLNLFGRIGAIPSLGFFYGFTIMFAALIWFFTPEPIINSLPEFSKVVFFSFACGILLIAAVGFMKLAIESLPENIGGSLFMFGLLACVLLLLNYPIWGVINNFPSNYYLIGFAFFIFILFTQILILIFFGVFPGIQNSRRKKQENTASTQQNTDK